MNLIELVHRDRLVELKLAIKDSSIELDAVDADKRTPLMHAVVDGKKEMVSALF